MTDPSSRAALNSALVSSTERNTAQNDFQGPHGRFENWPVDILAHVTSFLTFGHLSRLLECGSRRLIERLRSERIVDVITVPRKEETFPLPRMAFFCRISRLHLYTEPRCGSYTQVSWLLSLPPTIEHLNCEFPASAVMWIRPSRPGRSNWLLKGEHGYEPIALCELLPRLRTLRLTGDFTRSINLAPIQFAPGTYRPSWNWSNAMIMAFVKQLPRQLESLEMSRNSWTCDMLTCLPPTLTRFILHLEKSWSWFTMPSTDNHLLECIGEAHSGSPNEVSLKLPEELYTSLTHLKWCNSLLGELSGNAVLLNFASSSMPSPTQALMVTPISKFVNLQSVDLLDAIFLPSHIQALPRGLHTLAFTCQPTQNVYLERKDVRTFSPEHLNSATTFDLTALPQLPTTLTSLTMSKVRLMLDTVTESKAHNAFVQFLPPYLTHLCLDQVLGTWNVGEVFAPLAKTCPNLTWLELHSELEPTARTSMVISNFGWIPPRLCKLALTCKPLSNEAFKSWPRGTNSDASNSSPSSSPSFALHLLEATGMKLTDDVCAHLPPNLTELTTDNTRLTRQFMAQVSCSLIALNHVTSNLTTAMWPEVEFIPHSPRFAPKTTTIVPRHLQRVSDAVWSFQEGVSVPKGIQEISPAVLAQLAFQDPRLLKFDHLYLTSPELHPLPASLTSATLQQRITQTSRIWECPNLTSLKVDSLHVEPEISSKMVSKALPSLKTLHVTSMPPNYGWLEWPALKTITDLKFAWRPGRGEEIDYLTAFRKMPLLRLEVDITQTYKTNTYSFLDYIPETVEELTLGRQTELPPTEAEKVLGLPNRPRRSLKVLSAPRTHFSVTLEQLKQTQPTLTELGMSRIEFENLDQILAKLEPSLERISILDLIRVECPSITSLGHLPATTTGNITWNQLTQSSAESLCTSIIQKLPKGLKEWRFPFSSCPWTPGWDTMLPRGLTSLDLFLLHVPLQDEFQLPETLTSLRMFRQRQIQNAHPKFFASLPRSLRSFAFEWLRRSEIPDSARMIEDLPRGLTNLELPAFVLRETHLLPPQLEKLTISKILPSETNAPIQLPVSLTSLIVDLMDYDTVSHLAALPHLTCLISESNPTTNRTTFASQFTGAFEQAIANLS